MRTVKGLCKNYDGRAVLDKVDFAFKDGQVYCLMGASGHGKTTFLQILSGLLQPDAGELQGFPSSGVGMVFQEDRLCEVLNPVENLQIIGCRNSEALLREILPADCLGQPVRELSGGMRRRVAVARAIAAESEILLMDEPFTGLDEETKLRVIRFIREHRQGRLLIAATHQAEDAELLGGEILRLD